MDDVEKKLGMADANCSMDRLCEMLLAACREDHENAETKEAPIVCVGNCEAINHPAK